MLQIKIDEKRIKEMLREELKLHLNQLEQQIVFWDMKELQRQTNMSINTIKDTFFYDERFKQIKRKVGQKWYFPAEETKRFLLTWLNEQNHN